MFGWLVSGFKKKRLEDILTDIEQEVENTFGADVIQTESSPLGQINGIYSGALAETWDVLEQNAFNQDPRTASSVALNSLAIIMTGQPRLTDETDEELIRRLGVGDSSLGQAQNLTDDLILKLRLLDGVTIVDNYVNETKETDRYGLPANSYSPVIAGTFDETEVAQTIWSTHPVGMTVHGTKKIQAIDASGKCQLLRYSPACKVYIAMRISICFKESKCCTNYELEAMKQSLIEKGKSLIGKCPGFAIGETVDRARLFSALDEYTGVQIVDIKLEKRGIEFVSDLDCADASTLTTVIDDDGNSVFWATDDPCSDSCNAEVWCDAFDKDSICLSYNEYPDFDQSFIEFEIVDCEACDAR